MYAGDALAGDVHGHLRQKEVVVNQRGAVANLNEHVGVEHGALGLRHALGALVLVHQVLGDAGALGLPVAPHAHDAVVDMVAADGHVDGGMQLDAGGFRAAQLLGIADVVDVAVLNGGEHAAHAAHNTRLLAMMDMAAADDVAAHVFLQPSVILAAAHRVALHLGGALHMLGVEVHVVFGVAVLAQGNAAALAVADLAVLDDPAAAPVRADHAVLIGGGGRPGGGGLVDVKPADGDVAHAGLFGHEAVAPHRNLDLLGVGILALEVGVEHGVVAILLGVPLVGGFLGVPGAGILLPCQAFLQSHRFIHHAVIEVHAAGVAHRGREVPVTADEGGVGVVRAEHAVVHAVRPHIALVVRPAG